MTIKEEALDIAPHMADKIQRKVAPFERDIICAREVNQHPDYEDLTDFHVSFALSSIEGVRTLGSFAFAGGMAPFWAVRNLDKIKRLKVRKWRSIQNGTKTVDELLAHKDNTHTPEQS